MTTQNFTITATSLIANFGKAAHHTIGLYREGGERLAEAAGQRWQAAFKEASPKLTPETRKNAKHAKDVVGRSYARGLAMSTDGAGVVIDTLVGAAIAGVERMGEFTQGHAQKA